MAEKNRLITSVRELGWGLSHLLFPRLCEGCRKPLLGSEHLLCLHCESQLSRTNFHHIIDNETALRLSGRIPYMHATSLAYFGNDSLLQHLIHGLKYKSKKQNGIFLGQELGKVIATQNWNIDAIIPVPLHKKKLAARGFNQSACIAEGVAQVLKCSVADDVLFRARYTESQTDKTREQRIQNVQNAFQLTHPESIKGLHVLLIDDVLTTGATVESCALTLTTVPGVTISIATAGLAI